MKCYKRMIFLPLIIIIHLILLLIIIIIVNFIDDFCALLVIIVCSDDDNIFVWCRKYLGCCKRNNVQDIGTINNDQQLFQQLQLEEKKDREII